MHHPTSSALSEIPLLRHICMRIVWTSLRDLKNPSAGGAERTTFEVARRLVERGHEIYHLVPLFRGSSRTETWDGVRVMRLAGASLMHPQVQWFLKRRGPFDVVVDDLAQVVPLVGELFCPTKGIAFFRHLHRRTLVGQVRPPFPVLLSLVERQYHFLYPSWGFVTESDSSVDDLEHLDIPKSRVRQIPPGVELEKFTPGEGSSSPSLVYFGGFREYKRPQDALRVLAAVRQAGIDASMTLVGDGPSRKGCEAVAAALEVTESVSFVGKVSDEELVNIIRRSWVNIHCATAEGWCLSAMEAAACGVPTAGYSVPGLRDSVSIGKSALLARDGDIADLSRCVRQLIEEYPKWKGSARAHACRFPWTSTVNEWESALSQAASAVP